MEIGHILTSQVIIISCIIATITTTESTKCASTLKYLTDLSFVRVTGEKGAILLLFSLSTLFLFVIDTIYSQAKLYKMVVLAKNAKKSKRYLLQNIFVCFINFISAYIFQSLNFRVYNLIGLSLILLNLKTLFILLNLRLVKTWIYSAFIFSNVLIFAFTYIKDFERFYSFGITILKLRFI